MTAATDAMGNANLPFTELVCILAIGSAVIATIILWRYFERGEKK
jgi:hypothetical protein